MKTLIYGSGKLGEQVLHVVNHHFGSYLNVVGFVDDTRPAGEDVTAGYQTLGNLETVAASRLHGPNRAVIVPAIGYGDQVARGRALDRAVALGYGMPTLVHPRAWVEPGVEVGDGAIVLAGVLLDQGVKVGENCYLDQGVKLGENTTIGPNNYLAAGSAVGGGVTLGRDNFLGLNTTVTDGVSIGDANFINAKSLVYKDLGSNQRLVQFHEQARLPLAVEEDTHEVIHG